MREGILARIVPYAVLCILRVTFASKERSRLTYETLHVLIASTMPFYYYVCRILNINTLPGPMKANTILAAPQVSIPGVNKVRRPGLRKIWVPKFPKGSGSTVLYWLAFTYRSKCSLVIWDYEN